MSKKTMAIMCSGSFLLGMGHIMRTLVIAEAVKNLFNIVYISKSSKEYAAGVNELKKRGYDVYYEEDGIDADILLADSYDMTEIRLSELRKKYGRLIYIDDLHCLSYYDCDIIINKCFMAENLIYNTPKECEILLGTKYALLRSEFQNASPTAVKEKAENVLITMGGTDPKNTSVKILNILKDCPYTFNVAVGNSFSETGKSNLKNLTVSNKNIILHMNPKMAELISKCDLAVTANGGTTHEIASLGVPQISLSIAENQNAPMKFGENNGLFIYAGKEEDIIPQDFLFLFNSLMVDFEKRKQISETEKQIVNKNGVSLIAQIIIKKCIIQ